jgi:hypothetical protein
MPNMASPQMATELSRGLHLSCPPDWFLTRDTVRDIRRVAHPVSVVAGKLPMPNMVSPQIATEPFQGSHLIGPPDWTLARIAVRDRQAHASLSWQDRISVVLARPPLRLHLFKVNPAVRILLSC